jgi:threonine dehydrogenase-like Zn-dependent dehydrogenase
MNTDSPETMKATVWNGKPLHVTVESVPKPKLLSSEDAIVRLTSSAICGSDLHIYRGVLGSTNPPWVLGHEGVGIVESVGEAVQNVKRGDRVIVPCTPDDGVLNIDRLVPSLESYGNGEEFGSNDGMQGMIPLTKTGRTTLMDSSKPNIFALNKQTHH